LDGVQTREEGPVMRATLFSQPTSYKKANQSIYTRLLNRVDKIKEAFQKGQQQFVFA
jgi:hypothetical protein